MATRETFTQLSTPLTPADAAQQAGVDERAYRHLQSLLFAHQSQAKKAIYHDFAARDVVDFLFTYVYAPEHAEAPGRGIWSDRFHAVYLRYHERVFAHALHPHPALKMGYGLYFLETLWVMFRFYGLTHELDTQMLLLLCGWLENRDMVAMTELPDELYRQAFRATDPMGERRRAQVVLADTLFGHTATLLRSPLALGTINAGLALLGKVAPKNFKDIVPYALATIEEGQKVVKPHLHHLEVLRQDMLRREHRFIEEMLNP